MERVNDFTRSAAGSAVGNNHSGVRPSLPSRNATCVSWSEILLQKFQKTQLARQRQRKEVTPQKYLEDLEET